MLGLEILLRPVAHDAIGRTPGALWIVSREPHERAAEGREIGFSKTRPALANSPDEGREAPREVSVLPAEIRRPERKGIAGFKFPGNAGALISEHVRRFLAPTTAFRKISMEIGRNTA